LFHAQRGAHSRAHGDGQAVVATAVGQRAGQRRGRDAVGELDGDARQRRFSAVEDAVVGHGAACAVVKKHLAADGEAIGRVGVGAHNRLAHVCGHQRQSARHLAVGGVARRIAGVAASHRGAVVANVDAGLCRQRDGVGGQNAHRVAARRRAAGGGKRRGVGAAAQRGTNAGTVCGQAASAPSLGQLQGGGRVGQGAGDHSARHRRQGEAGACGGAGRERLVADGQTRLQPRRIHTTNAGSVVGKTGAAAGRFGQGERGVRHHIGQRHLVAAGGAPARRDGASRARAQVVAGIGPRHARAAAGANVYRELIGVVDAVAAQCLVQRDAGQRPVGDGAGDVCARHHVGGRYRHHVGRRQAAKTCRVAGDCCVRVAATGAGCHPASQRFGDGGVGIERRDVGKRIAARVGRAGVNAAQRGVVAACESEIARAPDRRFGYLNSGPRVAQIAGDCATQHHVGAGNAHHIAGKAAKSAHTRRVAVGGAVGVGAARGSEAVACGRRLGELHRAAHRRRHHSDVAPWVGGAGVDARGRAGQVDHRRAVESKHAGAAQRRFADRECGFSGVDKRAADGRAGRGRRPRHHGRGGNGDAVDPHHRAGRHRVHIASGRCVGVVAANAHRHKIRRRRFGDGLRRQNRGDQRNARHRRGTRHADAAAVRGGPCQCL